MKKRMVFSVLLFAILINAFSAVPANAYNSAINDINITVKLDNKGTAYITEVWDVEVASGTEWYLVQGNLGKIKIKDFSVSDETGRVYKNEGAWNVDRTIEQKAGKCGIVDKGDGEYELCWGVGSYGKHIFIVKYTMTDFVKSFDDYDGFNHMFVAPELSSRPKHIKVEIEKKGAEFSKKDQKVWAFGFDGTIFVKKGKIIAESAGKLDKDNYVVVMVQSEKNIFSPSNVVPGSFEQVKEEAFENSSYTGNNNEQESNEYIFLILTGVFLLIMGVFLLYFQGEKDNLTSKDLKNIEWYSDIPFEKSIVKSVYCMKRAKVKITEGNIIGAYLLKWMYKGLVKMEMTEKKGFPGINRKPQPSIIFNDANLNECDYIELKLYNMIRTASGQDNILQENELYKWSKKNYSKIDAWYKEFDEAGEEQLIQNGQLVIQKKSAIRKVKNYTPECKEEIRRLLGLRKYLKDYTLINERKAIEVTLWEDYLVFATLFNMSEQVSKDFKKIYPEYFESPELGNEVNSMDIFITMSITRSISGALYNGANSGRASASSSAGGGGFSSLGGGGGFSGGGVGGGSR